jgi:hypothetical protein
MTSTNTTSTDKLRQDAERCLEIDRERERLQDERDTIASELEAAARKIALAKGGIIRSTSEHPVFREIDAKGRAHFRIYDGYEMEWTSGCEFSFDELADPDKTIAAINEEKRERARTRAQQELERAQARVAELDTAETTTNTRKD